MYASQRFLEGELIVYNGIVWVVKGFQHPPGYVIAYPRYNLNTIPPSRIENSYLYMSTTYWDCLHRRLPMVPLDSILPYTPRIDSLSREFARLLTDYSDIDPEDIYYTGSRAIGFSNGDIDLVVYGATSTIRAYNTLLVLREAGVTKPLAGIHLIQEHVKHRDLSLEEYRVLRGNSVLQGVYKNTRYSIRLVPYSRGYFECLEPAKPVGLYNGAIEILEEISSYTTPAYYKVRLIDEDKTIVMTTYRIKYTELPRGLVLYVKNGVLEKTRKGLRLVPDHGVLKPIILETE